MNKKIIKEILVGTSVIIISTIIISSFNTAKIFFKSKPEYIFFLITFIILGYLIFFKIRKIKSIELELEKKDFKIKELEVKIENHSLNKKQEMFEENKKRQWINSSR